MGAGLAAAGADLLAGSTLAPSALTLRCPGAVASLHGVAPRQYDALEGITAIV